MRQAEMKRAYFRAERSTALLFCRVCLKNATKGGTELTITDVPERPEVLRTLRTGYPSLRRRSVSRSVSARRWRPEGETLPRAGRREKYEREEDGP